jgi:hypothetical protein
VPPVEAWLKVWIDEETYASDVHAFIACTACHGGQPLRSMSAHDGLIADPSADPETGCGSCHPNIAPYSADSLHSTLRGYDTAIYERSIPEHHDTLEFMEVYHCNECHATCGDCHIAQPDSVGGGLLEGHAFVRQPPMSQTCTACHGSRVKNEYYGLNEGIPGDVHLRQARLACTDCHSGDQMHGMGEAEGADHRYDGVREPQCEDCHADQIGVGSGILQHEIHGTEILSCQSCHSVAYTNCTNCHVDRTEDDIPYYKIEEHSVGFFLGRNPLRSAERPYRYVPVRHVPIDPESFSAYGEDLLPNFLNRPTWTYATPHNIQRNTPQTESCTTCHGNEAIFLTADKVIESERDGANLNVIVDVVPPMPDNVGQFFSSGGAAPEQAPTEAGEPAAPGTDDSFWGGDEGEPAAEDASSDDSFWGSDEDEPAAEDTSSDDSFWGGGEDEPAATEESESDDSFWGAQ